MEKMQAKQPQTYDRPIFGSKPPKKGRSSGRQAQRSVGAESTPGSSGHAGSTPLVMPKRRMSLNAKMFLFILVIFAGIATAGTLLLRQPEDRFVLDTYQYVTVGMRDFRNVVSGSGRVTPTAVTVLAAPTDVRVRAVYVAAGDDVNTGDLLAVLESATLQTELDKAQNEYDMAQIEAEQAKVQYARDVEAAEREVEAAERALADAQMQLPVLERLYNLGGISRKELDDAQNAVILAEDKLEQAKVNLTLVTQNAALGTRKADQSVKAAEENLQALLRLAESLEVRAPAAGRILEAKVDAGDQVKQGDMLFRLADVTSQVVETTVTPEQARDLRAGSAAVIRSGGTQYPAVVSQVGAVAVASESSSQVAVRLSLSPDVAELFLPYAPVSVEIELGELKDRMYLPRGPFFTSGNASFVYVLDPSHTTAERRDVRYGAIDGNYIEVVSGLDPGDEIIFSSYTVYRSYRSIDVIPEGGRQVE